jgi:deoxyribodipyrimidine photo-lyase
LRVRAARDVAARPHGDLVLYWMIAARRPAWNAALDRAVDWAAELRRPLVILEALRAAYPHASDRLHRFVIDGMAANERAFARTPALYVPYVEPEPGAGGGLLEALARRACVVVTDEFPCFFLPRMVRAAAARIDARLEVVDSNGLLPLAASDRAHSSAAHFRRFVQKALPDHLDDRPRPNAFRGRRLPRLRALPRDVARRWPAAGRALLEGEARALAALPIDHRVAPAPMRGGWTEAERRLRRFVARGLPRYDELRSAPDAEATSRLSPYLHFGHVSSHRILDAVTAGRGWTPARLASSRTTGARRGWWGLSAGAEAFLDQLVVWRELGYHFCWHRPDDYDRWESLPEWARRTLEEHAADPRPHRYAKGRLEAAATHDGLWNAAQAQLLREGWFHNTLRMLWGKKILEWSPSPRGALRAMTAIMNRWSLDGRDPNSYTGFFWTLGRFDRPWPERPVYGRVRSMSSERTAKKVAVREVIAAAGAAAAGRRPEGGRRP